MAVSKPQAPDSKKAPSLKRAARRSRHQIPSAGFNAKVAKDLAKAAKEFASAFLRENLCGLRVKKSLQNETKLRDRTAMDAEKNQPRKTTARRGPNFVAAGDELRGARTVPHAGSARSDLHARNARTGLSALR